MLDWRGVVLDKAGTSMTRPFSAGLTGWIISVSGGDLMHNGAADEQTSRVVDEAVKDHQAATLSSEISLSSLSSSVTRSRR